MASAELEMEDVLAGHGLSKAGAARIQEVRGGQVFGECTEGGGRHLVMIRDIRRPFDRFVCTCLEFVDEPRRFCRHLVAVCYRVQAEVEGAPRLFGDPEEGSPITQAAEDLLFKGG